MTKDIYREDRIRLFKEHMGKFNKREVELEMARKEEIKESINELVKNASYESKLYSAIRFFSLDEDFNMSSLKKAYKIKYRAFNPNTGGSKIMLDIATKHYHFLSQHLDRR